MNDDSLIRELLFGSSEEGCHFRDVTLACELTLPRSANDARDGKRRRLAELEVRHCDTCRQTVTLCATREHAEAMGREGACIAIPGVLAASVFQDVTRFTMGRPVLAAAWARRLFAEPTDGTERMDEADGVNETATPM